MRRGGHNVALSAHNVVAITLIATLGLILINLGASTQLGQLPLVGPVLGWLSRAH